MAVNPDAALGLSTVPEPAEGQYRFIKATTARDLDTQVERERASIVAAFPSSRLFSFDVMGAGAGAIFQCRLGFNPGGVAATNLPLVSDCTFDFAEAAEPAELLTQTDRVIAQARAAGLFIFGQAGAGAGAGARFMLGYAFATLIPTPGSPAFLTQSEWFINADTGSDDNPGTAALPLASWAELSKRWGDDPVLPQTTDVFIETDLDEILQIRGSIYLDGPFLLRIHGGVKATLATGTFVAVTPLNEAAQQRLEFNDTGFGSFVGERIRITTGVAVGAISWGAESLGADDLAVLQSSTYDTTVDPLPVSPALVTPVATDGYVVETLFEVLGIDLEVSRPDDSDFALFSALVEDLNINPLRDNIHRFDAVEGAGGVIPNFAHCKINGFSVTRSTVQLTTCFLDVVVLGGPATMVLNGTLALSTAAQVGIVGGGIEVNLTGQSLFQDCSVIVFPSGSLRAQGTTAAGAIFGAPAVGALRMLLGSEVNFQQNFLWGDGNADVGIEVEAGAVFSYKVKPTITGAVGDTRVGGILKPYAQIPFFNTARAAGVVDG